MTKGLARIVVLVLLALNCLVAYAGIVFAMLSEAGYLVGAIFIATNTIGLSLAVFFLSRNSYLRAIWTEAAVSPAAYVLVGAIWFALIYSGIYEQNRHWDEPILTSRGNQLTVKRTLTWTPRGDPWSYHSIRADLPGVGVVTWNTTLAPWMLDQAQDETWYLVGRVDSFKSLHEYGLFDEPGRTKDFVAYRLTGKKWERIVAADFPGEFHGPNLIVYPQILFEEVKRQRLYFDGTKFQRMPDGLPIADGAIVNMEFRSRINFPFDRERAYIFQPSAKYFDDGRRLICKGNGVPCTLLEKGLDERFGRGPLQQVEAK
jgi:hypothetical protein